MDRWETELLGTVKRLAAPPDEQAAYVRRLKSFPSVDELALEFNDMFVAAPEGEWADCLRRLDEALSAMSGAENTRLWTVDALDGPEWAAVRVLARDAVACRPH